MTALSVHQIASHSHSTSLRRPGVEFFARDAVAVSRDLLGAIIEREIDGVVRRARLCEVEAYLGPRDRASHASKGRTKRTEVMFGPPGRAYVYFVYGMHWMLNVVVGQEGQAHAILLRGAQPLDGWNVDLTGPAKLARAFAISRDDNGGDLLDGAIRFWLDDSYTPRIEKTPRIGIDYAEAWARRLLRFVDATSPASRRLARPKPARPT